MSPDYLEQIRQYVVVPTLRDIGLYSESAERLVMATGMAESRYEYIDQVERGGERRAGYAYGFWQMEEATHDDIWRNYLKYNQTLANKIRMKMVVGMNDALQMQGNMYYGTAMCRTHYRRISAPLPDPNDIERLAAYWKKYYNTHLGAGTIDGFIQKCMPIWDLYKIS